MFSKILLYNMFFVQLTILFLLLVIVGVVANHLKQILINDSAPFFTSNKKIIDRVVEEIEVQPGMTIYELGCGKAKLLKKIRGRHPDKELKLVGVENFILPLTLLKIQNRIFQYNIQIRDEDIFQTDISEADVIYCFLNVEAMKKLKHKLLFQAKSGTKIISYQFSIPDTEPEEVIKIPPRGKIFIYKIP